MKVEMVSKQLLESEQILVPPHRLRNLHLSCRSVLPSSRGGAVNSPTGPGGILSSEIIRVPPLSLSSMSIKLLGRFWGKQQV